MEFLMPLIAILLKPWRCCLSLLSISTLGIFLAFGLFILPVSQSFSAPIGAGNLLKETNNDNKTDKEDTSPEEPVILPDPFGRDTPRGTVQGLLKALANHDDLLASSYLQLEQGENPITLVRKFKKALDAGGRLQSDLQIDDNNEGDLTDSLPLNFDEVGVINYQDKSVALRLIRVKQNDGHQLWLFSQETLQKIPAIVDNSEPTLVEQYTVDSLNDTQVFNVYLSDIMAVAVLTVLAFSMIYVLVWLFYLFMSFLYPQFRNKPLPVNDSVVLPLAVVITAVLLPELLVSAGVSVTVREPVTRVIGVFAWVSLTWLLLRIIDSTFGRAEQHSHRHKRVEQIAMIGLARRLVKVSLLVIAVIVIFGNLGFDLTTGIATLGLGGLALALGAQKTVENLVGSVVVVADRPVRVGDYIKFGEYDGIVQEIGIRSTRIRTFERSIVTIPNGEFASMQIENFTAKDMFRFLHLLHIKRTCKAELIHKMLRELDKFLNEHYLTNQVWNQVRISELRQDCYVIECQAYISANGMREFFDKQNVVLIDLLKEVDKYDVEHALPTQQILLQNNDKLYNETDEKHLIL